MKRREALRFFGAAATGLVAAFDPFETRRWWSVKPMALAQAPSTHSGDFLLLSADQPAPDWVVRPEPRRIPSTEGGASRPFTEHIPAELAAIRYQTRIAVLLPNRLPDEFREAYRGDTQVRANSAREPYWFATEYRLPTHPHRAAVWMRSSPVFLDPTPIWPSGSPTVGYRAPQRTDFLPGPGVVESPLASLLVAHWRDTSTLHTVSIDTAILGLELSLVAQALAVVDPDSENT